MPLLLRFECFLLAFCCSRRGVSIYLEALSTAFLLLVVLWPCSNRRIRCGLPEWFFLVPAPPWSIPMGCSGTVVGGFGGLLSILANRSPIFWVGRYDVGGCFYARSVLEKDRGRLFYEPFPVVRMIAWRIDLQMHFSPPNKLHHFSHQSTLTWLDVMLLATLWYHRPTTNSFSCTVTSCNLFPNPNNSMQDKTSNNMCKHRLPQLAWQSTVRSCHRQPHRPHRINSVAWAVQQLPPNHTFVLPRTTRPNTIPRNRRTKND